MGLTGVNIRDETHVTTQVAQVSIVGPTTRKSRSSACNVTTLTKQNTDWALATLIVATLAVVGADMLNTRQTVRWYTPTSKWRDVAAATGKPVWVLYTSPKDCIGCRELETLLKDERIIDVTERFVCVLNELKDPGLELQGSGISGLPSSKFLTCNGQLAHNMGVTVFETPHTSISTLISHLEGGYSMTSTFVRR